jgi:L,D-transpeptidase ErfK/SrfK
VRSAFLAIVPALLALASPAKAALFPTNDDLAGRTSQVTALDSDTLYRLARRFDVGIEAMQAANPGVDAWLPGGGRVLTVPGAHVLPVLRSGIVIDLRRLLLFYFAPEGVTIVPIGTGMQGWPTPLGATVVSARQTDPVWVPPESIRRDQPDLPASVPPGPDNPMGAYALLLGWQGYAIHGTNRPYGVGRRSSHGCIRLYPEDIKALYAEVKPGIRVTVVSDSFDLGWHGGGLYLEAPPLGEGDSAAAEDAKAAAAISNLAAKAHIDWAAVADSLRRRDGIPQRIGVQQQL